MNDIGDFTAEHPHHGQDLRVAGAIDSDGDLEFNIGCGSSYDVTEPTAYLNNEQVRALVLHLQRLLGDEL